MWFRFNRLAVRRNRVWISSQGFASRLQNAKFCRWFTSSGFRGGSHERDGYLPKVRFFAPYLPVHSKIGVSFKVGATPGRLSPCDFARRSEARRAETSETSEIFDLNASSPVLCGTAREMRIDSATQAIVLTIVKDNLIIVAVNRRYMTSVGHDWLPGE